MLFLKSCIFIQNLKLKDYENGIFSNLMYGCDLCRFGY